MEENKLTSSQIILRFAIVFFITIWASIFMAGCAPTKQIDYNFVKVLGVTVEGDTILINVNSLRPKIYNNYYYDNWNTYPKYNYNWNPPVIINTSKPNRPTINKPRPNHNPKPIEKPNKNPKKN